MEDPFLADHCNMARHKVLGTITVDNRVIFDSFIYTGARNRLLMRRDIGFKEYGRMMAPLVVVNVPTCNPKQEYQNTVSITFSSSRPLSYLLAFAMVLRALPFLNHSICGALKVWESSISKASPFFG